MSLYTATAQASAGRNGQARSDDGLLNLALTYPKALGGSGTGTNPEQLFAAGYAACFSNAILYVAKEQGIALASAPVTAQVSLLPQKVGFALGVSLAVELALPQSEAEALVMAAHQVCPYSNAVRNNIDVAIEIKGEAQ
ncbi:organic hydroperoxide resistance protein [Ferrimonas balearica]|uniref:organic hydroperoxide resistance protein n=1 Tax=Ferrimonas balearica TaxID=44012 RepID=UPI001C9912A6|nr:organic hydroperoxide resistance protein [Ferrimonas balearica]MBY5921688.1 organic hydroperoxide resistance protein [Ferrimonas balearica]MBY5994972.1 organic hydroperoxide resistance protein [Ferrimonas balearica]